MKNVDGPAVRLVDKTDAALAAMPTESAVTQTDIASACREGLMAVAVEAVLATAMAIMADEAAGLCGGWNARDPERTHVRGGTTETSLVIGASGYRSAVLGCVQRTALVRCRSRRSGCSQRGRRVERDDHGTDARRCRNP